jgi:hypothetical protein
MSRREILLQLGLCVAILLFFSIKDTFFPSKPAVTPPPVQSVAPQAGARLLDAEAIAGLELAFPHIDGRWDVYLVEQEGVMSYTLTSSDIKTPDMAFLAKPGYEINTSARVNVKDTDALAALLMRLPTNDTIVVIGANGVEVDAITFALIGDGARKSGLNVEMGSWTAPVITPSPEGEPTATPTT